MSKHIGFILEAAARKTSADYYLSLEACDVPPEIEALAHMPELTADDLADLHIENCSDL